MQLIAPFILSTAITHHKPWQKALITVSKRKEQQFFTVLIFIQPFYFFSPPWVDLKFSLKRISVFLHRDLWSLIEGDQPSSDSQGARIHLYIQQRELCCRGPWDQEVTVWDIFKVAIWTQMNQSLALHVIVIPIRLQIVKKKRKKALFWRNCSVLLRPKGFWLLLAHLCFCFLLQSSSRLPCGGRGSRDHSQFSIGAIILLL